MSSSSTYGKRTISSPSLYGSGEHNRRSLDYNHNHKSRELAYNDFTDQYDDEVFYVIGDRVYVDQFRPGSVAYFGEVKFASGDWVGVVLDDQTGNHDGKIHGYEYFQCAPFHGIFVRPNRVSRMPDSALGSSGSNSRVATPLPTFHRHELNSSSSGFRSKSPGSSTLGSYYYDEDYRQDKAPSVASLERKLKLINRQGGDGGRIGQPTSGSTADTYCNKPTTGILKPTLSTSANNKNNIDYCSRPASSIGNRAEEFSRRLRASSASPSVNQKTVFNFRPRREQLSSEQTLNDDHQNYQDSLENESRYGLKKYDRVVVQTERGELNGVLKFIGHTDFAIGEWAGIELDVAEGKNDGSVLGHRYFYCAKNYGLFVPINRVRLYNPSSSAAAIFGTMRSTITSPPPLVTSRSTLDHQSRSTTPRSMSRSSSDYHNNLTPTSLRQDTPTHSSYSSSPAYYSPGPKTPGYSTDQSADERRQASYTKAPLGGNAKSFDEVFGSASNDYALRRPRFDDQDIEMQLKKTLQQPPKNYSNVQRTLISDDRKTPKPKSVQYTFTSSKYNGNPIARKTLLYD